MTLFTYVNLALLAISINCQEYYDDQPSYAQQPISNAVKATPVPILKQINKHNDDGSYTYGFEGADGTFKIETKFPNGEVKGKYGYKDDTGKVRIIDYGANKYGFQPSGEGITVPALSIGEEPESQEDEGPVQQHLPRIQTKIPKRVSYKPIPAADQTPIDYEYEEQSYQQRQKLSHQPYEQRPQHQVFRTSPQVFQQDSPTQRISEPQNVYQPQGSYQVQYSGQDAGHIVQPVHYTSQISAPKPKKPILFAGAVPTAQDNNGEVYFTPAIKQKGLQHYQQQNNLDYTQSYRSGPKSTPGLSAYYVPEPSLQHNPYQQAPIARSVSPQRGSKLDYLIKEFGIPSGSNAQPLHDITFGIQ